MISSAPTSSPTSAFNPFLYATVGDDKNGMALTVLSVFARQDVDTRQEAADLSRLSGETAIQRITSRLETIPGDPSLIDRAAIAQRLLALLPRPRAVAGPPGRIFGRLPGGIKSIGLSELSVVLIYPGSDGRRRVDFCRVRRAIGAGPGPGPGHAAGSGPVTRMNFFTIEQTEAVYWADFAFYAAVMSALIGVLVIGAPHSQWPMSAVFVSSGIFGWSALEYVIHRYVLHGLQPFRRWHAAHHLRPAAFICAPTILTAAILGGCLFLPAWRTAGVWNACALTLGVLTGYMAYAITHHATHQWRTRNAAHLDSGDCSLNGQIRRCTVDAACAQHQLNPLAADGEAHGSAAGNSRLYSRIDSACSCAPSTRTDSAVSSHRTALSALSRALGRLRANVAPPCSTRIRGLFEVWSARAWISARAMRGMPGRETRRIQLQTPRLLPELRRKAHDRERGARDRVPHDRGTLAVQCGTAATPRAVPGGDVDAAVRERIEPERAFSHAHSGRDVFADPKGAGLSAPGCAQAG
jgi:hypothetical protein